MKHFNNLKIILIMKKTQNKSTANFLQQIRKIFEPLNFKISKLIFITLLFGILNSCDDKKETTEQKQIKIPLVKLQNVSKSKLISSIFITGTVQANIVTEVKSPADGIIENLFARENQYVEKDKLIAVINPTDRVSLISSNIENIENLELKLKTTDKNSDVYQNLLTDIEKSKSDLEYARNIYKTIPVVCPMSGLVTQRWIDKGSQVSTKDKIITITDMNSLVIKAEVNERYFEAIKQGKKLPAILNAYPNDTLEAIISLVYPQIDPVSRSVKFDIKLQNFNKSLLPGMMATIKIPVAVINEALTVPEYSVLTSPDNKNFVFTVDSDSIAHKKIIKTGITSNNEIQIIHGLIEKDKIVISGQDMLKDSMKVKVMGSPKVGKK